ncbi:hypothetical protein K0T92_15890 [Paenibacillus oenotherae]|uniref:Secreted protein n=1 Tax=Paenibacillus oenotherae TaxID=1435645 RepID=A0ABS7D8G2_9BACL|nr:hypothetical protein [Paenibacillus oenotherae]MBW7476225.1 hypothetical protein [Paenibacillus oenotherae]
MLLLLVIIAVAGSVLFSLLQPPVPESAAAEIQQRPDGTTTKDADEPAYTNIHL